jgi:hypothetical protein
LHHSDVQKPLALDKQATTGYKLHYLERAGVKATPQQRKLGAQYHVFLTIPQPVEGRGGIAVDICHKSHRAIKPRNNLCLLVPYTGFATWVWPLACSFQVTFLSALDKFP